MPVAPPVINQGNLPKPIELKDGSACIVKEIKSLKLITEQQDGGGPYYEVEYSSNAKARIYPPDKPGSGFILKNGDGSFELGLRSPLRANLGQVLIDFGLPMIDQWPTPANPPLQDITSRFRVSAQEQRQIAETGAPPAATGDEASTNSNRSQR